MILQSMENNPKKELSSMNLKEFIELLGENRTVDSVHKMILEDIKKTPEYRSYFDNTAREMVKQLGEKAFPDLSFEEAVSKFLSKPENAQKVANLVESKLLTLPIGNEEEAIDNQTKAMGKIFDDFQDPAYRSRFTDNYPREDKL